MLKSLTRRLLRLPLIPGHSALLAYRPKYHQSTFTLLNQLNSIAQGYERGLYEITPINKTLNKVTLSMAYTPGVGTVCKEIEKNPKLADILTMRGRSVAIITQGRCFHEDEVQPGKMPPIVDWCIAQIKYYSGVDGFPFILRKQANIDNVIKDLANSYAAILVLDPQLKFNEKQIPADVAVLRQAQVCKLNGKDMLDCQDTARVLGYVLSRGIRGVVSETVIKDGYFYRPATFKKDYGYFQLFRDGRSIGDKSIEFHRKLEGKIHVELNFENIGELKKCFNSRNLLQFAKNRERTTGYQNISAIVTDGTAILGLGDIGPKAGLPVMQGKSLLFKTLGGVDIVPVCINKRKTAQQTIEAILDLASYFKAINLQDIKAPECFHIQRGLKEKKILPVFHDDQHGTSIVALAGLINALKIAGKKFEDVKIVMTGAGAAGATICRLLIRHGAKNIIMLDTKGAIWNGRVEGMNPQKQKIAEITNPQKIKGKFSEVIKGADVFIGVSGPGTMNTENVKSMAEKPIIFALANPDPEITYEQAMAGGAFIYGSGRSDYNNQINNSVVFPGIFRGIHEHDLTEITEEMKETIAVLIAENMDRVPDRQHIIVDSLDRDMPVIISKGLEKYKKSTKK